MFQAEDLVISSDFFPLLAAGIIDQHKGWLGHHSSSLYMMPGQQCKCNSIPSLADVTCHFCITAFVNRLVISSDLFALLAFLMLLGGLKGIFIVYCQHF